MEGMLKLYSPINKLKQIGENIWIVDGNEIHMSFKLFKAPFTTRMTVVKLDNNKLWIHSPIAFNKELDEKISYYFWYFWNRFLRRYIDGLYFKRRHR